MHDCLIIGGGVIGLSIAYDLVCHGGRVHVIDRQEPGREASWAGAGILPPANLETAVHPWDQLQGLSHALHPEWAESLQRETGIDTGYRRCGGIYLARRPGDASLLHAQANTLREQRIAVEHLDVKALRELEPVLVSLADHGRLLAAYFLPDEAQLRNPRHLQALAQACRQRGATITSGAEVVGFEIQGGQIAGVQTTAGMLTAKQFCVASGAWTRQLLQRLGIATGIKPIRGQMILFRCTSRPFRRILNEGPRYLVPRNDGRVLAGSSEEDEGFDKSLTTEVQTELKELALGLVPALGHAEIEASWSGLRPGSLDGQPYLGHVPGLDNAFVAAGHFRSGLHTSPATAVVMGQLIRGQSPQIDLAPFRVGRG